MRPTATRRHLLALRAYVKYIDDLGEEPLPPANRLAALDALEAGLRDLYAGRPVDHPAVHALAVTASACDLPLDPLLRLIEGGRVDPRATRYATFDQVVGYCRLSVDPLGELALHVFGQAGPERVALSDRLCTALWLVERLQGVASDHRRGRVYLPKADLDRFGVAEGDLSRPDAGRPVPDLIRFESERAAAWLESGAPLVSALRGGGRFAVSGHLARGRATLAALADRGYRPLPGPGPARQRILAHWLAAAVRSSG